MTTSVCVYHSIRFIQYSTVENVLMREHLCGQTARTRVCVSFHLSFCLIVRCAYYTGAYSHVNLLLGFISICLSDFQLCLCVSVGLCMSLFVAPYPLSNGGWGWGGVICCRAEGMESASLFSSLLLLSLFSSTSLFFFVLFFHHFLLFFFLSSFFYSFVFSFVHLLFSSSLFPFLFVLFWFFLSSLTIPAV